MTPANESLVARVSSHEITLHKTLDLPVRLLMVSLHFTVTTEWYRCQNRYHGNQLITMRGLRTE